MADAEENQEPQVAQEPEADVPDNAESQQVEDTHVASDGEKEGTEDNADKTEQEPIADSAAEENTEQQENVEEPNQAQSEDISPDMKGKENLSQMNDGGQTEAADDKESEEEDKYNEKESSQGKDNNVVNIEEDTTGDSELPVQPDQINDSSKEEKQEETFADTGSEQRDVTVESETEIVTGVDDNQSEQMVKGDSQEGKEAEENTDMREQTEDEPAEGGAEEPAAEESPVAEEQPAEQAPTEEQAPSEDQALAEQAPTEEHAASEEQTPPEEQADDEGQASAEQPLNEEQTGEQVTADEAGEPSTETSADPFLTAELSTDTSTEKKSSEQETSNPEMGEKEVTEISQKERGEVQILPPDMPSEEPTQDDLIKGTTDEASAAAEKGDAAGPPTTTPEQDAVPEPPHLPSPERSHTTIEGVMSTSALNIVWSFGLNRNVPVLNLSDGVREAIMYPCAHVGIMYDFKNNKQHTLQAHLNPITCSAISQDKRWLVTGDVGPDAMVNIWDTYTGIPIQTMFDPNTAGGVLAVAFTPDSRYLATMSALPVQTLAIWDWTVDGDVPICSADLKPEYGVQNFIYFDPTDIHHLVTNSESQVLFFHWEEHSIEYFAPPLSDSDFNKPVGRYTQSLFQMGIARALTATSIGNLVVWDNNRPLSSFMDVNQSADKKALKIIKVQDKGINVLTTTDKYIVLGDTAGHVKFFDQGLRLIYWYQDFNTGPCTAISFAYMPDFEPFANDHSVYPSDATKQAKPFIVRNFIVGTAIAVYGNMTTDGSKFKIIHREHDAAVHALASHPKLPIIAIGSYSGLLKLWNFKTKETVGSKMFEKTHIQTVCFDPKGFFIVVGCTNGSVYILDSVALLEQMSEPFRYARETITHIAFSHNSVYFATADAGHTITVYKRQRSRKEGSSSPYMWHGRYRSHYKPIRDLLFDIYLDTNQPKLLSLGEDRMLIEYELSNPGKNHVIPKSEDRIEQSGVPRCMCLYPPITKEHFLFTANDEYKLKCYNSTTKMCRKTVLGPTYGSPISKMMVVPTTGNESANRFLAYITDDKVGLHILPASGNPHLAMALIAHPSGVSNIECSFDGAYLFTAGGPDYAVHMWEINLPALEAQAKLGGEDLIPFYGLLEGGRDGDVFAELEDLFYYAQLRHQGISSMERREIGNRVPITEVPYIMRAMGFYPSEQEIEDMLNEIKYDDFVHSGQYQVDIDLGQFIKLYVNHRPAFGLAPDKLLWAFKTLADSPELGKGGVIERGDLLDILQKKGEHMTEMELAEHLTTLLGFNREGGSCEQEVFDAEQAGNFIAENLPYDINAEIMVNEILGFSLTQDPPEVTNVTDVIKSGAT